MVSRLAATSELEALIAPVAHTQGLDVVQIQFHREPGGAVLRVLIERPDVVQGDPTRSGVTLEDCTSLSRALSPVLDENEALLPPAYRLEVSSPGIERPLVKRYDFDRFKGLKAHVSRRGAAGERKNFTGMLAGLSGDDVLLTDAEGNETRIALADIDKAHLVYDF